MADKALFDTNGSKRALFQWQSITPAQVAQLAAILLVGGVLWARTVGNVESNTIANARQDRRVELIEDRITVVEKSVADLRLDTTKALGELKISSAAIQERLVSIGSSLSDIKQSLERRSTSP